MLLTVLKLTIVGGGTLLVLLSVCFLVGLGLGTGLGTGGCAGLGSGPGCGIGLVGRSTVALFAGVV